MQKKQNGNNKGDIGKIKTTVDKSQFQQGSTLNREIRKTKTSILSKNLSSWIWAG